MEFWLINPPVEVVNRLQDFFAGCSVEECLTVPEECLLESESCRTFKGKETHAARLMKWFQHWDGSPRSLKDVRNAIALTESQWKEVRKTKAVTDYFDQYIESKKIGREIWISRLEAG